MLEVTSAARGYVAAEVVWEVSFWRVDRDGGEEREKRRRGMVRLWPLMAGAVLLMIAEGAMKTKFDTLCEVSAGPSAELERSLRYLYLPVRGRMSNCFAIPQEAGPPILRLFRSLEAWNDSLRDCCKAR